MVEILIYILEIKKEREDKNFLFKKKPQTYIKKIEIPLFVFQNLFLTDRYKNDYSLQPWTPDDI